MITEEAAMTCLRTNKMAILMTESKIEAFILSGGSAYAST